MSKKTVTSYAALGVGLAIVLTFGLTAISSIVGGPQNQFASQNQMKEGLAPVPAAPAPAPSPAPPSTPEEAAREAAPATSSGTYAGGAAIQKAPGKQKEQKSYSVAAEVPSTVAGLMVVLPYIAAAIVGSVVFVVTRKRAGW